MDSVDRESLAVKLHPNRINQKRHIAIKHLDNRMIRMPAVLLDIRIEYPQLSGARIQLLDKVPAG